jgi:demethylmenaquinone methyltransferase/2-methoxy-6-polyprenyl-1,4-benzoquinol methylase
VPATYWAESCKARRRNLSVKPDSTGRPLHKIFTSVTPHYDLINHIITLGMDTGWRKLAARECLAGRPARILDLCCGTGDLAMAVAAQADYRVAITGVDFSLPMLATARSKVLQSGFGLQINFVDGDAAALPFPDGYFDCAGISFAFRNLTYKNPLAEKHIAEILRVLKPGGRFVSVESSQPRNYFIRRIFRVYLRYFVAKTGRRLSHNRGAYDYLAQSIAGYYTGDELKKLLLRAGFSRVTYRPLFFGAAGIHAAVK